MSHRLQHPDAVALTSRSPRIHVQRRLNRASRIRRRPHPDATIRTLRSHPRRIRTPLMKAPRAAPLHHPPQAPPGPMPEPRACPVPRAPSSNAGQLRYVLPARPNSMTLCTPSLLPGMCVLAPASPAPSFPRIAELTFALCFASALRTPPHSMPRSILFCSPTSSILGAATASRATPPSIRLACGPGVKTKGEIKARVTRVLTLQHNI